METNFYKTYSEIDTVDVLAFLAVFLGTSVLSGLAAITFAGYDMAAVATTLGQSTAIQYAMAAPLIGYVAAIATNGMKDGDFSGYTREEKIAFTVGLGGLVVFVLSPDLVAWVQGSTLAQIGYVALSSVSVLAIAAH